MPDILRPMLSAILDYAGTFPPAALPLDEAVSNLRRYRSEPEAWMLGRNICPAPRLADLANLNWNPKDGPLSVLVPGGQTEDEFIDHLAAAQESIRRFPHPDSIDALELLLPAETIAKASQASFDVILRRAAEAISARKPNDSLTMSFEFAAVDPSDGEFQQQLAAALAALAAFNRSQSTSDWRAGFKFRTGGATAAAIPTVSRFAMVIAACRDSGVFWKATGGLHHPWRHVDRGLDAPMHGFLNVIVAASLAATRNLDAATIEAILVDDQPDHFRFDAAAVAWRDFSASAAQVAAARTSAFRSFGSCSFDEPRDDLKALGWL